MGKVIRRTQKERDLAIQIVSDGGSFEDASRITGYGIDYVRQLCTKAGIHKQKFIKIPGRVNQAIQFLKDGMYPEDIATLLCYSSVDSIYSIAAQYGIECKSKKKDEIKNRDEKIIQLRKSGYSMKEIAESISVTESTVYVTCKKYNLNAPVTLRISRRENRQCKNCGKPFICDKSSNQLYCCEDCQRYDNHRKNDIIRKRLFNKQKVEKITLKEVAENNNDICYLCGCPVNWNDYKYINGKKHVLGNYPSIDHITPLCKGGTHSWDNVKLAHIRCNSLKGTKCINLDK